MSERVGSLRPLRAPQAFAAGHGRFFLDVRLGQLGKEPAGDRTGPLPVDATVCCMEDRAFAPCARDCDISEAPFLFEHGFVDRVVERAALAAGQERGANLAGDLALADDQTVEAAGDAEEMADRIAPRCRARA